MSVIDLVREIDQEMVAAYVRSLECAGGGFCFYGLDEPNLADTFFATHALHLLEGAPAASEKTVAFVRHFFQSSLGEGSLWGIYYGLKVLRLLNQEPPSLLRVEEVIRSFLEKRLSASVGPQGGRGLELLSHVAELIGLLEFPLDERWRMTGQDYTLQFQMEDGGFGTRISNLEDTAYALTILRRLGCPIHNLASTQGFALQCEQEDVGLTVVPGSSSAFLEDIHFGLVTFSALDLQPRYKTAIARFVFECQTGTYGFARSRRLGIPTLEYTYMAIRSLDTLQNMA